jgi:hypothetical protein
MRVRFVQIAVVAAALLLTACGGNEPSGSNNTPSPSATAANFDVAAWRAAWDPARQAYATELATFANQLDFLVKNNASAAQISQAVANLAGNVAKAADAFLAAVDKAGAPPQDRADLTAAVANLRAALQEQSDAYGAVAACGPDPKCQNDRYAAVQASQGTVGEALKLIPSR